LANAALPLLKGKMHRSALLIITHLAKVRLGRNTPPLTTITGRFLKSAERLGYNLTLRCHSACQCLYIWNHKMLLFDFLFR